MKTSHNQVSLFDLEGEQSMKRHMTIGHKMLDRANQSINEKRGITGGPSRYVLVQLIRENPKNKRIYDETRDRPGVERLKESILLHGMSGGIVVKEDQYEYVLLSGHLRFRAYQELLAEGKVTEKTLWVEIKKFNSPEEESAYLVMMNTATRDRTDVEKIGEIYELYKLHKAKSSLVSEGENLMTFLCRMMKINTTQMYKYVNLLERNNMSLNKAKAVLLEHETVNKADLYYIQTKSYAPIPNVENESAPLAKKRTIQQADLPPRIHKQVSSAINLIAKSQTAILSLSKIKGVHPDLNKQLKRMGVSLNDIKEKLETMTSLNASNDAE